MYGIIVCKINVFSLKRRIACYQREKPEKFIVGSEKGKGGKRIQSYRLHITFFSC